MCECAWSSVVRLFGSVLSASSSQANVAYTVLPWTLCSSEKYYYDLPLLLPILIEWLLQVFFDWYLLQVEGILTLHVDEDRIWDFQH